MFIIKYIFIVSGRLQKRRPANGEGVVLKLRTFPDGGGGGGTVKIRTSENC